MMEQGHFFFVYEVIPALSS